METKVILLNGPPNCGKDCGADFLCNCFKGVKREFKAKLYDLVKCIYSVSDERFWEIYNNRKLKEKPLPEFDGLSVRQAMIKVSEEVIKPAYGKQYFGEAAAKSLVAGAINIFSDSGFEEELEPVIKAVGERNILLIRIFREGCTFVGDSRNYLSKDIVFDSIDLSNNDSLAEYQDQLIFWTGCFLNRANYNRRY